MCVAVAFLAVMVVVQANPDPEPLRQLDDAYHPRHAQPQHDSNFNNF